MPFYWKGPRISYVAYSSEQPTVACGILAADMPAFGPIALSRQHGYLSQRRIQ